MYVFVLHIDLEKEARTGAELAERTDRRLRAMLPFEALNLATTIENVPGMTGSCLYVAPATVARKSLLDSYCDSLGKAVLYGEVYHSDGDAARYVYETWRQKVLKQFAE